MKMLLNGKFDEIIIYCDFYFEKEADKFKINVTYHMLRIKKLYRGRIFLHVQDQGRHVDSETPLFILA